MDEIKKVVRDGKVAILISTGYGAGWSTESQNGDGLRMLFDAEIVQLILDGEIEKVKAAQAKYPDGESDTIGYPNLKVCWMPQGTNFLVHQYYGNEFIRFPSDIEWITA